MRTQVNRPMAVDRRLVSWRPRELLLLILVGIAFATGWVGEAYALAGKPVGGWERVPLLFGLTLLAAHLALMFLRFQGDELLLPLVGLLSGLGLLVLRYLEPAQEHAQFVWICLGLG
ncbi:MAG: hypothetical protein ACYDAG_17255, partial [Chloroflexota bacterium]